MILRVDREFKPIPRRTAIFIPVRLYVEENVTSNNPTTNKKELLYTLPSTGRTTRRGRCRHCSIRSCQRLSGSYHRIEPERYQHSQWTVARLEGTRAHWLGVTH